MFNLIVTIISIALVTATAAASIFYGGAIFTKSTVKAEAAQIASETSQLYHSAVLFQVDNGGVPPASVNDLTDNYIKIEKILQPDGVTYLGRFQTTGALYAVTNGAVGGPQIFVTRGNNKFPDAAFCNALAEASGIPAIWTDSMTQAGVMVIGTSGSTPTCNSGGAGNQTGYSVLGYGPGGAGAGAGGPSAP